MSLAIDRLGFSRCILVTLIIVNWKQWRTAAILGADRQLKPRPTQCRAAPAFFGTRPFKHSRTRSAEDISAVREGCVCVVCRGGLA